MVKSVATLVIVLGSFLFLNDVSYAAQQAQCTSGDGDICICQGSCWANETKCGCN